MVALPETGFVRLHQIIGCKRRGVAGVFPVSRSTWYQGVKDGRYPAPTPLGARAVAWRVEDIRALIQAPQGA